MTTHLTGRRMPNGAIFYGETMPFPLSRAVRAGDFVITSGFGSIVPKITEQIYDANGFPQATGAGHSVSFAEEMQGTLKMIVDALSLAGCTLADVVDSQVWLKDPRDFQEMNRVYATYFKDSQPVRTVFQNHFMMQFRVEMKAIAYKPL